MLRRGFELVGVFVVVCGVLGCVSVGAFGVAGGRVYEMVSPIYKGGYGALRVEAVAPNGDSVLFYSPGSFAGAPSGLNIGFDYIARRGSSSWSTAPLMVPAALMPSATDRDVSPALDSVLVLGKPGANQEEAFLNGTEAEFMLHSTGSLDTPASWELAGMVLKAVPEEPIVIRSEDASPDFCHILLRPVATATGAKEKVFLTEEAAREPSAVTQVYELDRGCGGEPVSLGVLGLNNKHRVMSPSCTVEVGTEGKESPALSKFNAVADGGREVFFRTCTDGLSGHHQVFVRLDGSRTLEVSKPLGEGCSEVPCGGAAKRANADFIGASEDGSRVFFTTTAPLEPATDTDSGNDLYMATIGCPTGEPACEVGNRVVTSLVQVSHDLSGEAGVQGVVRLAPDGSRAYFVAHGDLLDGVRRKALEGEGRPVPRAGADNLYVYDSASGEMGFIADLCSGVELSGAVEDLRCPSKTGADTLLWGEGAEVEAQTAGLDGRFLVFATSAQLTAGDTDTAKDIYRYDAVTGMLERVSAGENGHHANGNDNLFNASIALGNWGGREVLLQYELRNRAVSEDGSRIVFDSSEPLSPAATNGLANVYEWHKGVGEVEGSVSLISGGSAEESVEDVVISPEGNDVFFVTVQGLVAQDTDSAPDIYDARVNGGSAATPAPREPCSSDACQGPLTNPAPLLVPGSVSQAPGEGLAPARTVPLKASKTKASKRKAPVKRKAKRKARRAMRTRRHFKAAIASGYTVASLSRVSPGGK